MDRTVDRNAAAHLVRQCAAGDIDSADGLVAGYGDRRIAAVQRDALGCRQVALLYVQRHTAAIGGADALRQHISSGNRQLQYAVGTIRNNIRDIRTVSHGDNGRGIGIHPQGVGNGHLAAHIQRQLATLGNRQVGGGKVAGGGFRVHLCALDRQAVGKGQAVAGQGGIHADDFGAILLLIEVDSVAKLRFQRNFIGAKDAIAGHVDLQSAVRCIEVGIGIALLIQNACIAGSVRVIPIHFDLQGDVAGVRCDGADVVIHLLIRSLLSSGAGSLRCIRECKAVVGADLDLPCGLQDAVHVIEGSVVLDVTLLGDLHQRRAGTILDDQLVIHAGHVCLHPAAAGLIVVDVAAVIPTGFRSVSTTRNVIGNDILELEACPVGPGNGIELIVVAGSQTEFAAQDAVAFNQCGFAGHDIVFDPHAAEPVFQQTTAVDAGILGHGVVAAAVLRQLHASANRQTDVGALDIQGIRAVKLEVPASISVVFSLSPAVVAGGNQIHVIRLRSVRSIAKYKRFNQIYPDIFVMSLALTQLDIVVAGFGLNVINGFRFRFELSIGLRRILGLENGVIILQLVSLQGDCPFAIVFFNLKQVVIEGIKVNEQTPVMKLLIILTTLIGEPVIFFMDLTHRHRIPIEGILHSACVGNSGISIEAVSFPGSAFTIFFVLHGGRNRHFQRQSHFNTAAPDIVERYRVCGVGSFGHISAA